MKTRKAKRLARAIEMGFCAASQSVLRKVALQLDRPLVIPMHLGDLVYQPRSNTKEYGVLLGRNISYNEGQPRRLSSFVSETDGPPRHLYRVRRNPHSAFYLDLLAGTDIADAAALSKDLSVSLKAKVRFSFNGVRIAVHPWSATQDIVTSYYALVQLSEVSNDQ